MTFYYCFVKGCNSTTYKRKHDNGPQDHIHFHKFPINPGLREKWIKSLIEYNKQTNIDEISNNTRICMKHFEKKCYARVGLSYTRLLSDSIPTLYPHSLEGSSEFFFDDNSIKKEIVEEFFVDANSIKNEVVEEFFVDENSIKNEVVEEFFVDENSIKIEVVEEFFVDENSIESEVVEEFCVDENSIKNEVVKEFCVDENSIKNELVEDFVESDPLAETIEKQVLPDLLQLGPPTVRYPGDIKEERILNMSETEMQHGIKVLKQSLQKKKKLIKKLQAENFRNKKKIHSLEEEILKLLPLATSNVIP